MVAHHLLILSWMILRFGFKVDPEHRLVAQEDMLGWVSSADEVFVSSAYLCKLHN